MSVAVLSGVAGIQARVAAIESRFASLRPATATAAATGAADFARVLGAQTGLADPAAAAVGASTAPAPGGPSGATADRVIEVARRHLGTPYVWGGNSPATGFDCSGLLQHVFGEVGIELPRVSRDQARAGQPVASMAEARPGDLLAFGSPVDHIGMYIGDGKMIVAPRTGDVVKVQDVYKTPVAIRRVLPEPAVAAAGAAGVVAPAGGASAGAVPFASLFDAAGARHGVSPVLLAAVAEAESSFDPKAVSHAGAQGLMQLMPATAAGLGVDALVPEQAVDGAARLLRQHLDRFGSVELALAAYNAGPGAVQRHGGVPPYRETQGYIQKVVATMQGAA